MCQEQNDNKGYALCIWINITNTTKKNNSYINIHSAFVVVVVDVIVADVVVVVFPR